MQCVTRNSFIIPENLLLQSSQLSYGESVSLIPKLDIHCDNIEPPSTLHPDPTPSVVFNHENETENPGNILSSSCSDSKATNILCKTEISNDPAKWKVNDETIDILLQRGISQNADADFSLSKCLISGQYRSMSKLLFYRTLKNGDTQPRSWLVYSESKLAVFCSACLLFGKQSSSLTDGYSDWSNIYKRIQEHENCMEHRSNIIKMLERSRILKKGDFNFNKETEKQIDYWRNVLRRVVSVVKSLASRGLPFRGSDENFGSLHNGNYMMLLELIEFDPFLSEHIKM